MDKNEYKDKSRPYKYKTSSYYSEKPIEYKPVIPDGEQKSSVFIPQMEVVEDTWRPVEKKSYSEKEVKLMAFDLIAGKLSESDIPKSAKDAVMKKRLDILEGR